MGFHFFAKNRIVIFGVVLFCLLMVLFPAVTASASRQAMSLWLNSIVPTMLPFFIMANFLKGTGVIYRVPARLYPPVMAFLSGYPMGARTAGDYFRQKKIDREELLYILSYSMITGPAFLIGAVGAGFFHSYRAGFILAASHYLSALFNRWIYRSHSGKKTCRKESAPIREDLYELLTDGILDSFKSVGLILAYMILFMIGTDLLQFSGLLQLFPAEELKAMVKGFFELTIGCSSIASCSCSLWKKVTMAAFTVTFGGMSVLGQTMSMLQGCDAGPWEICRMKLLQGMIAAILAFSLCCFML